jgi:hypothetical protein
MTPQGQAGRTRRFKREIERRARLVVGHLIDAARYRRDGWFQSADLRLALAAQEAGGAWHYVRLMSYGARPGAGGQPPPLDLPEQTARTGRAGRDSGGTSEGAP